MLAAAALACFANTLHGAFLFDDDTWIVENPAIGTWAASPQEPPARRVALLTLRLNHLLGGLDPFGYHLFNVAVHALAAVAVYALARLLLSLAAGRDRRAPAVAWSAFAGALLFAVHPLQTQAVAYVIQRMTSLAALFYVAALALYARARTGEGTRAVRRAAYAAALAAAALGMWTKEIVFTLPFAVVLLEAAFLRGRLRERALAVAPFLGLLAVIPTFVLRSYGSVSAARGAAPHEETPSRLDYLATQTKVVVSYLRLLALPVRQALDHDVAVEHGFASPRVILSALFLVALFSLGALLLARARGGLRVTGFGIVLFFLALSVESSVVPIVDLMNEHRVYLPSGGAALALAGGLHALLERRASAWRPLAAAIGAWALLLGGATVARNAVWRDGVALWRDVTEKSPRLARGHFNLGNALRDAGDLDLATGSWRRAVELDPDLSQAWNQLGNVALLRGDLGAAEAAYRRAAQARLVIPDVLYNLGLVLERTGRAAEARELYRQFLDVAGPDRRAEADALRARLAPER